MTNPWLRRRVLNYAHQGGAREAPSSTLFALQQALRQGATALELDVHATRDGELVVSHDGTVDRTTDGQGRIADLSLAELRRLDAAHWFVPGEVAAPGRPAADYLHRGKGPADPLFRIATLREVLQAFPKTFLNLDIKGTAPEVEPYEARLAALLREFGRRDDVIVASFLDPATEAFRAAAPELGTSAGPMFAMAFWQAVQERTPLPRTPCVALQVPSTFQDVKVVDQAFVARAHQEGLAVHVWTVDEPAEMRDLVAAGVDGIITDRPSVCAGVLRELGATYTP